MVSARPGRQLTPRKITKFVKVKKGFTQDVPNKKKTEVGEVYSKFIIYASGGLKLLCTDYLFSKGSKLLLLICLSALLFFISACTEEETVVEEPEPEANETVRIAYVDWVSEVASAHVVKVVLEEKLGYNCELLSVTAVSMWESVAAGDQDAMVAAWLPTLHQSYFESVKDEVEDLGPNLEGVEMGLVVPSYVPIDSIAELNEYAEEFDSKVIGIDPEAGLMGNTEEAMEIYELDDRFELVSGSDLTMTSALEIAYDEDRWIVVTGWTPHWKFARWDLKYLDDPENVYGEAEYIGTIVRQGLADDMPEVYAFFDNFYWTAEDMEQVMLWFSEEDLSTEEAAKRWVAENSDLVDQWLTE